MTGLSATVLPGGHSEWEPPDPFSNSEVKTLCADASVGFVNVKVGHCQALNLMPFINEKGNPHRRKLVRVFFFVLPNVFFEFLGAQWLAEVIPLHPVAALLA